MWLVKPQGRFKLVETLTAAPQVHHTHPSAGTGTLDVMTTHVPAPLPVQPDKRPTGQNSDMSWRDHSTRRAHSPRNRPATGAPGSDSGVERTPRPAPRGWRDISIALAWALGVFVIALWVSNGGIQNMRDIPSALTETGRLTGLIASYLLLLQVLLMARIPFVEKTFGQDGLSRLHRWVGFGSFTLMLGHIGLILLGNASGHIGALWGTTLDVILDDPGMLLAVAGTAALFLVVFTSFRAARRKLRYESWHLMHLYAYLGVGLALPHQLWTGRDFQASPVATAFWWSLYAAVAVAVIVFRLAAPMVRSAHAGLRVVEICPEGHPGSNTVSVVVAGRGAYTLKAQAGQFFQWHFAGPGVTKANPYSLSAAPRRRSDGRTELRFTAAMVGDGSSRLARLAPGTRVHVEGPYGRMHAGVATQRKSLLMGAGIGITPLRALLETLPANPGELTIIQRHSNDVDLVLDHEIEDMADARGAQYHVLGGHRVQGRHSWLPQQYAHLDDVDVLLGLCPDLLERDLYLCGAPGWMDAVEQAARKAGLPPKQIHVEHFAI